MSAQDFDAAAVTITTSLAKLTYPHNRYRFHRNGGMFTARYNGPVLTEVKEGRQAGQSVFDRSSTHQVVVAKGFKEISLFVGERLAECEEAKATVEAHRLVGEKRWAEARASATPVTFVNIASVFDAMVEVTDKDGKVHHAQAEPDAWAKIRAGQTGEFLMYDPDGDGLTWVFDASIALTSKEELHDP